MNILEYQGKSPKGAILNYQLYNPLTDVTANNQIWPNSLKKNLQSLKKVDSKEGKGNLTKDNEMKGKNIFS